MVHLQFLDDICTPCIAMLVQWFGSQTTPESRQHHVVGARRAEHLRHHQAYGWPRACGLNVTRLILLDNSDNMKAGPRTGEPAPMLLEYPRPSGSDSFARLSTTLFDDVVRREAS